MRHRLREVDAPPGRQLQLQLDEVEADDLLRHRVLDLEPRVDLHEPELAGAGVEQELHGPEPDVGGGAHQPHRRVLDRPDDVVADPRDARLLQHLLAAALHRAVAHAERHDLARGVRRDLDLDVPGRGDRAFQEQGAVPERRPGLALGGGESAGEVAGPVDAPDPPAAAPGGRLDHQRVADAFGVPCGGVRLGHRTAAPRDDGHVHRLGQQLGADLVAEPAHDLAARSDQAHPEAVAEIGELWPLGDEAPPHPGRVGPRAAQGVGEDVLVDVGEAARAVRRRGERGAERHGLVGLPDEGRPGLLLGVEGDRDHVGAVLVVVLADGADGPQRRVAAVDDGDAARGRQGDVGAGQGQPPAAAETYRDVASSLDG